MLRLQDGGHLCLFYDKNPAEQLSALIPFIQDALTRDEQFIYVADDQTTDDLVCQLEQGGVSCGQETARGRLKLWSRNEWRQPGRLSSERKARQLQDLIKQSAAAGFKGIRFAVEMTWTLDPNISVRQLQHWEATLNTIFVPDLPARIVCQYNRSRLAPEALLAALHTHPLAVIGGQVYSNAFYQAPLILQDNSPRSERGARAEARLDWMIAQLQRFRAAETEREQLIRKQAALAEARARQEHLQLVTDNAPVNLAQCDRDGRYVFVNRPYAARFGLEPHQLKGRHISEILGHKAYESIRGYVDQALRGESVEFEIEIPYEPIGPRFMLVRYVPYRGPDGTVNGLVAAIIDLSDQKAAEARLRSSEQRMAGLMSLMPAAMYTCDAQGRITYFNRRAAELWGREPVIGDSEEKFCGAFRLSLPGGDPLPHEQTPMAEAVCEGKSCRGREVVIERMDGSKVVVNVNIEPLRDPQGNLAGAINVFQDITGQREADRVLRDSEIRFRGLVNSVEGIVWECAVEPDAFRFTFVSEQAERLLGFPIEQWMREPGFWPNHLHPDDRGWAVEFCASATRAKRDHQFEYRMIAADGRVVWLRDMVTVVVVNDCPARLVGVMVDITEFKKAGEASRRLAAIVESSSDAILSMDLDGVIQSWNRGAEELYGYTNHEVLGQPATLLIPSEQQSEEARILERIRRGECVGNYETVRQRKDGSLVEVSLTVSPVRDASGRIAGASKIARDISDRKQAEQIARDAQEALLRANEELEQRVSERTASLQNAVAQMEEFSYSVSHDLRGPLRAMQGYCHILLEDAAAELAPENMSHLRRISQSAERLDRLVQDVLAYTRASRIEMPLKRVEMEALVADVIRTYTVEHIPVPEITVHQPLLNVIGHEPSLVQCLSNLVGNALKFVPEGTVPRIGISAQESGAKVRIWISDNGIGIHPKYQQKIFEMFERLPEAFSHPGTGVGLAIVKKAVHRMRGDVGVESEPGAGSRFWIELPRAEAGAL